MINKLKNIPSLLYIDDNLIDLEHFEEVFSKEYKIFLAQNKNQAFEILKKNDIQILLTDYRMPDINGIEILEMIYKKYPHIIRIIVTAYQDLNIIEQAVNRGSIHGYISKPLDINKVKLVINNAYEKHYLKEANIALTNELKETIKELKIKANELKKEISKRKEAQELNKYFRAILDNTDDHAVIKDLNLRWIACNDILVKLCKKKDMNELIGKTDLEIFGDYPHVRQYMKDERKAQALKKGEYVEREEIFVDAEGKVMHTHVRKFPVFDENNNLIATANISRDITEKKLAQEKIKRLNEELDKSNKKLGKAYKELLNLDFAKSQFLRMISHEMRTPLNGIIGPLKLLKDKIHTEDINRLIKILDTSTSHLENYTLTALQITQFISGSYKIKNEKVDLVKIINTSIDALSDILRENETQIQTKFDDDSYIITGENDLILKSVKIYIETLLLNYYKDGLIEIILYKTSEKIIINFINYNIRASIEEIANQFVLDIYLGDTTQHPSLDIHLAKLIFEAHKGEINLKGDRDKMILEISFDISA
ncbi:MAG: response regulator [Bacteroidales bacterium]|nr:response regulator [Bacteroidales bacterium]